MKLRLMAQGALILALLVLTGCNPTRPSSSLLLGGDVMLYRGGEALFPVNDEWNSPWGELLVAKSAVSADLFAVNLESPFGLSLVSDNLDNPPMNLCADDSALQYLEEAGINLVINNNNHTRDCGPAGIHHTEELLDQAGIFHQGNQSSAQFIPAGDAVVAVLSLNDYEGDYEKEIILEELKKARQTSDLVLVSVHWGHEYQAGPSKHQQELAQVLIDAGADVIWGHHPHVLQRVEWLRSSTDGHRGLVIYSLGNALSDQWMLPDALRTAVIRLEFTDHKVKDILVIPLQMEMETRELHLVKEAQVLSWYGERIALKELEEKGATVRLLEPAQNQ